MACHLPPSVRDSMVRAFRQMVYAHSGYVEFPAQAQFRLATEGMVLTSQVVTPPPHEPAPYSLDKLDVREHAVRLLVPCDWDHPDAFEIGETGNVARYEWRKAVPRVQSVRNLRSGDLEIKTGVIAHHGSMLASFKAGKSKNIGMWMTGFACLPGATIDMVGLEYSTSQHEFNYFLEALRGGSKPIIQKRHVKYQSNNVDKGDMYLELTNGFSLQVSSWHNKGSMRGGQMTVYVFNEIYQLPGLDVFTGHAQNLRAEQGYAAFTSTPDKPWVKILHQLGHGSDADWVCVCDNDASGNPFTFSLRGLLRDLPDWDTLAQHAPHLLEMCKHTGLEPGKLMSREKFLISWLGKIGGFVGRVYAFDRKALMATPDTHPFLFTQAALKEWTGAA